MFFDALGRMISRYWPVCLAGWAILFAVTWALAPPWREVARDGEFNFLPPDVPSLRGERLLRSAFPGLRAESSIVIVASRRKDDTELTDADRRFIAERLRPGLRRIADEEQVSGSDRSGASGRTEPIVVRILTFEDREAGPLLISEDRRASIVVVDLTTDMMSRRNVAVVGEVEGLIDRLVREKAVPEGLRLSLSGSAALGRDMAVAEARSARAIESWTVWLVILLLLVFYRAPLIAMVPLVTLFVAYQVGLRLLAMLARAGYVELFEGLEVYASVVVYGAGVDYNLFLISRYREEAEGEPGVGEALALALGRIGGALAASAATVTCGIGTLMFAEFGKFREAGLGISFCLVVMLFATMTLTPAVLRLTGGWAFWPRRLGASRDRELHEGRGWTRWLAGTSNLFDGLWRGMGQAIARRPGTIWLATVLAIGPMAGYAVLNYDHVNYGLIQDLPDDAPSVEGTKVLTEHFPVGYTGPLTLVIRDDRVDFSGDRGVELVRELAGRLERRRDELKIADLRSLAHPLGLSRAAQRAIPGDGLLAGVVQKMVTRRAIPHYVSDAKDLDHHATRLDIVLAIDPYTREAIDHLGVLAEAIRHELPDDLRQGSEVELVGATASLSDLKAVAEGDRNRINLLVTLGVLAVLVVLLRRLAIPIYLILSVLFGYLVTLGATHAVFRLMEGPGFPGLDWTVPIFLFTLLIAVGEDYNIILVTRVDEERRRHGPVAGAIEALARTGGIISGCGFIMAGTFSSLAFGGSLARMYELGFALTFGVLLDTFVVRPILVPAYLVLVDAGRLGPLGPRVGDGREAAAISRR